MNFVKCFAVLLVIFSCSSQKKFQIIYLNEDYNNHYIADGNGVVIRKLDSAYTMNFNPETVGYFSVFSIRGEEGWTAIDINKRKLFQVYNTEIGTPSPDDIVENRIRIVGENGKIGFADKKGNIIIKPQFEMASSFHRGKAIIAENCEKKPWLEHPEESDCQHYSIECKRHGFINKKGEIIKFGDYTFSQIEKEIGWKYK